MDQGVIQTFKTPYLQKTWHALSLKCDVSLSEFEKAAQALVENEVELQKNVVQRHWQEFTIRDAIWHVRDAWKEVTQSCICGAKKELCPQFAVDFQGFDLTEKLSEELLKLAKKVGLDELEEDVDSQLQTIDEELSTEDLDELEKQQRQLEEEAEAEQQPTMPSTMRHLMVKTLQRFYTMLSQTMDYLEEIDPDVEQAGLCWYNTISCYTKEEGSIPGHS